jgi:hypothetical protein
MLKTGSLAIYGRRKTDDGRQTTEDRRRKTDDGGQTTKDRRRKTEGGGQKTEEWMTDDGREKIDEKQTTNVEHPT